MAKGESFKALRKLAGNTQEEMGRSVGRVKRTWRRLEAGQPPTWEVMLEIVRVWGEPGRIAIWSEFQAWLDEEASGGPP